MEVVKDGFNSRVKVTPDNQYIHEFDSPYEADLRHHYRQMARNQGLNIPDVVARKRNPEGSMLVSEPAKGENVSDNLEILKKKEFSEKYWDAVSRLHSFETKKAGRLLDKTLPEYIDYRFDKLNQELEPPREKDQIVLGHRDLNPSNLYWAENLEIIDFGSAEFVPRHYDTSLLRRTSPKKSMNWITLRYTPIFLGKN